MISSVMCHITFSLTPHPVNSRPTAVASIAALAAASDLMASDRAAKAEAAAAAEAGAAETTEAALADQQNSEQQGPLPSMPRNLLMLESLGTSGVAGSSISDPFSPVGSTVSPSRSQAEHEKRAEVWSLGDANCCHACCRRRHHR